MGRRRSPSSRASASSTSRGEPREGWREALPVFAAGEEVATRDAGRTVMQALKPFTPTMVGGAADLVESTKTEFEGAGVFSATHAGRNIAFGIREHAMGSIVNGIALEPAMLRPYGSTFLIFSDYMRPAVRLSALMGLPHGLGVDARLGRRRRGRPDPPAGRAPHGAAGDPEPLVRPARPTRTRRRWPGGSRSSDTDGPGRAGADPAEAADARPLRGGRRPTGALRGAYTLWQRGDGEPDAIVIATGQRGAPRARGARSRSRPTSGSSRCRAGSCSSEQDDDYRDAVLPPSVEARVAVEAGVTLGWERYASAIDRYRPFRRLGSRTSAIFAEFGITAGAIAAALEAELAMKVAAAFDHRGVKLRDAVLEAIAAAGHDAVDLGTDTDAVRIDYPDKALELGMAIRRGEVERGVLVCGSGVGASVAASKIPGIRAAICHDTYSAHQGVEHDDMNVLCLGSEIVGAELARELVRTFLGARFDRRRALLPTASRRWPSSKGCPMAELTTARAERRGRQRLDRLALARDARTRASSPR